MIKRLLSLPPLAFALETAETYNRLGVARSAAALSYFLILTLFPLLVCVNYIIGLFHMDLEQLLLTLEQLLPGDVLQVTGDYLTYVAGIQSPALLWASLFTILVSASAGLRTLFHTMDDLFQAPPRPPLRRPVGRVVHHHVLPIRSGLWLSGLPDRAAGVALLLREYPAAGGGGQPGLDPAPPQVSISTRHRLSGPLWDTDPAGGPFFLSSSLSRSRKM